MSKTIITADMVGEGSELIGMTLLDGEDKVTVGQVYDSLEDLQVVKSLRLPEKLYDAAIKQGHPAGFSGVVRDALVAYLAPERQDVRHALSVLQQAVNRMEAA